MYEIFNEITDQDRKLAELTQATIQMFLDNKARQVGLTKNACDKHMIYKHSSVEMTLVRYFWLYTKHTEYFDIVRLAHTKGIMNSRAKNKRRVRSFKQAATRATKDGYLQKLKGSGSSQYYYQVSDAGWRYLREVYSPWINSMRVHCHLLKDQNVRLKLNTAYKDHSKVLHCKIHCDTRRSGMLNIPLKTFPTFDLISQHLVSMIVWTVRYEWVNAKNLYNKESNVMDKVFDHEMRTGGLQDPGTGFAVQLSESIIEAYGENVNTQTAALLLAHTEGVVRSAAKYYIREDVVHA